MPNSRWWQACYVDQYGKPVKRDKAFYPYSYDPYVVWASRGYKGHREPQDLAVDHSDRLQQWDSGKYQDCYEKAGLLGISFARAGYLKIQRFLRLYHGQPGLKLRLVMEATNAATGYRYWIFFYDALEVDHA